jgi:hypothetical protein
MDYRLVFLTVTGDVAGSISFHAVDDLAAIRRLQEMGASEWDVELWRGARRLTTRSAASALDV